ncbi:peptide-methionine (S)-S-oxide reductase MsrA [Ferrimonas balearica]|uniref:peptide-methionine (S)-S-oxide reductase MsrA n=1 Tax=Ferrimonas balearica TaxID=44012 RepID=UPI001C997DA0|nr:peptide-methionine (S)-S-oxide reductase MsrA [Ferrimonas balearica]MBY5992048.1 peptide-methionine (S)-S-oxide reductase MsrA [Ferrimonas balearica]
MRQATLGAGCFWGVEHFLRQIPGVETVVCGYMGGHVDHPTYPQVKAGTTGHAEVVQIEFDEQRVSLEAILEFFWQHHNPTTVNRQGEDVGSQYRSVIFFHDNEQRLVAEASKSRQQREGFWQDKTIVTEIVPASTFWPAEAYHQNYLARNELPSCHLPLY